MFNLHFDYNNQINQINQNQTVTNFVCFLYTHMCDTSVVGMYAPPSNGPDATPSTNNNDDDHHQQQQRKKARIDEDCHRRWGVDLITIARNNSREPGPMLRSDAEKAKIWKVKSFPLLLYTL
jgi:hypothetical protein